MGRRTGGLSAAGAGLLAAALAFVQFAGASWCPALAQRGGASIYTVANYPVQATAKDAVAAKEQALADGRKAAFRSLLKRLVPVTSYPRLKAITDMPLTGFYDGFAVRSESNSSTSYIATLDFSFRADAVRNLLRREGIPFVEEQASDVALIAAVREGGKLARAGSDAGGWLSIWRDLDTSHTLTPLRIESPKPIVHNDMLEKLVTGDDSAIRVLANEYGGENVVTAIAEVDKPAGRLHVMLAGRDAAGTFALKRSYRLIDGDVSYSMELAAVISLGIIEGRWKAVKTRWLGASAAAGAEVGASATALAGGVGEAVHIEAEFAGLSQWTAMRDKLEATPGVSGIAIAAMSARGADLTLSYPGGGPSLSDALLARGLSLTDLGGVWLLKSRY
ncbi:MAG: DUF2066 domain-containing protein [Hyphomicrobiaceae bacterium]|nr:DUF2066 domain-containing protein [Hyphomicrobiaceae bacterium]